VINADVLIIIIEDLVSVQNDRLHDPGLPPSVPDIRSRPSTRPHQRRSKHDCKIPRRHPILRTMLRHLVQMQRQLPQRRIIRIGQIVDDGVE
jgi:hypothetical protein